MAEVVSAPDPQHARSPEEFIARMRALKDWSHLTARELAVRADAAGDVLPRSTVARMLGRATLPREEQVAAFVRACGVGSAGLTVWLSVRADLAAGAVSGHGGGSAAAAATCRAVPAVAPVPAPAPIPAPAVDVDEDEDEDAVLPEPSLPRSRAVTLLSVLALTATVVAIAVTTRGSHHGAPAGQKAEQRQEGARQEPGTGTASTSGAALPAPAPGGYRIRAVHSALCFSEREGDRTAWVYQAPCADVLPDFSLERLDGGYWRIATRHSEHGPGCSGITARRKVPGALLVNDFCDSRGSGETFRLEPVDRPVTGFRLRPVHSDFCLTVPGGGTEPWDHVVQLPCRAGESGQVFRFDRVPSGANPG
ncbi:hypothetical protein HUT19_12660 [Streptomyces sp. NA02950]|uniref:helix-turn-helix domain-containing protein n=1 Tax=Streptomyces sp. NA02950 TaxID=2742137 RepID=UPI00158FAEFD|nr:hypothetical protein [Streptomyces sp. NA02950]QKV92494.1 hypothetical protein HUT19_12660 [Streptomyces sp. NA02950]